MWLSGAPCFGAVELIPLLSFNGTNGSLPHCTLVHGKNGEFYGTTSTEQGPDFYPGSIFKISADGHFSKLASFTGTYGVPWDGLVLGNDGNFYGTARAGSTNTAGAVFKMTPGGELTVMVQFDGSNGRGPLGLILGTDTNFYGITEGDNYAGVGDTNYGAYGTVFKMSPAGEVTTLFAFDSTNGAIPNSLVQGRDGNLYGTTQFGGAYEAGTVFQVTTDGMFTLLWNCDGTNGGEPTSVIQAANGNLYGAADLGGPYSNGTIFQLTTNGAVSILHAFSQRSSYDENADGSNPLGKLLEGRDGCIYGGTQYGGTNLAGNGEDGGVGTLFKITTNGLFTTLSSFGTHTNLYDDPNSGAFPNGLVEDQNGNFFGTTYFGGRHDLGSVFKLKTFRPILVISKPHQNAQTTNPAITIVGKTKPRLETAITNVCYQLNAGDWMNAGTTNNWTNWYASVTLTPGTNAIRAYAVDANGDASRTNTLRQRLR